MSRVLELRQKLGARLTGFLRMAWQVSDSPQAAQWDTIRLAVRGGSTPDRKAN